MLPGGAHAGGVALGGFALLVDALLSGPLDKGDLLTQSGVSPAQPGGPRPPDAAPQLGGAHVSGRARQDAPRSAGDHHGAIGRDDHLPATRRAQQSPCASPAGRGLEARRSLRGLHGESSALHRVQRGRRAGRALLHQRQFVPDGERTRLYRQQLAVEGADRLAGEARDGARGAGGMSQRRALSHRRGTRPRAASAEPRRGGFALSCARQSRTSRSEFRCSIPRGRPASRRAS